MEERELTAQLTAEQVKRIRSLDDLLAVFAVDTEVWDVAEYKVNSWEQHSVSKGVVPLYQAKARLVRKLTPWAEASREIWDALLVDAARYAPPAPVPMPSSLSHAGDPTLAVLAINDPHFGMLAWGKETGAAPQDLDIAVEDYGAAVAALLPFARFYPTARILHTLGNDMQHADTAAANGRRGGATTAGTPQDMDTRLAKIFTAARRSAVAAIDAALSIAPVDAVIVPGNHDQEQSYRLGEVLAAWYRNTPNVRIQFSPNKRQFYRYGANVFMLTHGEEYQRQRDNLPTIFATECPPELWVGAEHREILTGHNHRLLEGRYHPTSEVSESRGIRTRSLPGLTSTDAWHHENGYRHRRAATILHYRASGGIAGLHEHNP